MSLESRFWPKVAKGALDECWPWLAAKNEHGYGVMRPETDRDGGPALRAHRASLMIAGIDPTGRHVLHTCDNPPCVNPAHLYLGDPADNARDRIVRGRTRKGENAPNVKLTEDRVLTIRRRVRAGATLQSMADQFGVGLTTVFHVVHRNTWTHVGDGR